MNKKMKRIGATVLATTLAVSTIANDLLIVSADENGIKTTVQKESKNYEVKDSTLPPVKEGYTYVSSVESKEVDKNEVTLTLTQGERIRFTFLEDHVFRMYMAAPGEEFQEYPTPNSSSHTATITNKNDAAYYTEYNVEPNVTEDDTTITLATDKMTIKIDKATSMISVESNGKTVLKESAPLQYKAGSTIQTLATDENEYFYGGGMQNGRFSHKGTKINIVNENNWVDGTVTSPNPFYWSTKGYGVVRNTWKPGAYDFTSNEAITTTHNEERFDAYFFVDPTAETILNDYYELTGNPAELPEYAAYLGHLNCYNRDYWTKVEEGQGIQLGEGWYKESQTDNGGQKETLNGDDELSARQIIKDHESYDMPIGWFLPNDGYGCGYGQEATQAGNIDNLKQFADYAIDHGIQTGLWTQSNLWPADPSNPGKDERDIYKEVEAGVHSVKTDVAWVGPGYSFGLNGISVAYDAIQSKSGLKPNIVTLDGWAGTQRYGGIWSGDQSGGAWEYIRFHIPTFIGSSLSGQPNNGSDMDGIFGGKNDVVQTRDFQWKTFGISYMLDMDGWGSNQKSPWGLYNDETNINRAYLKLKAQLMPYYNTVSHEATANGGLPMVRAMFLEEENPYTLGKATQYQYMWGDQFLIAPIYQNTDMETNGDDVRNDIYLPGNTDIWVDYMTGKQYRGGQVLNGFDAPIWKLPVFVKNGSIIPMYPENNNPEAISDTNKKGLDRSQRIVEFYPDGTSEFVAYEDDGKTLGGASSTTKYTSEVKDGNAILTAEKAIGSYTGMVNERSTEFIVNVSKKPTGVKGNVGGKDVTFEEVNSLENLKATKGNAYFYDESPSVFVTQYADEDSEYANLEDTTTPKLYIKSGEKLSISNYDYQVVVEGFENKQDLGSNTLNESLATPENLHAESTTSSSITMAWNEVADAVSYDVEIDGVLYRNLTTTSYEHSGLHYDTEHTYRVRTVNEAGEFSNWSETVNAKTDLDPFRNTPTPVETDWEGGYYNNQREDIAFDHDLGSSHFHSGGSDLGKSLTIDYGKAYEWDKFEYYPRTDAGNGTVTQMDVSTSLDGIHWSEPQTHTWERNADVKTIDLKGVTSRYIKLTVRASVGNFFSARELLAYKQDGKDGFLVGDVDSSGKFDEGDITFYQNYIGLAKNDGDWSYIESKHGDIDGNGFVDAYDLAYVTTKLNDGISNPAQGVEGKMTIIPSKTDIKAGEEVELNVYGIGLKNVHAFSVELPQDTDLFTILNAGSPTIKTAFMQNFSKPRTHSDSSIDGYTVFSNIGNQETLNGTGSIATIRIKATKDFNWNLMGATKAVVVGQDLSYKNAIVDGTEPVAPETTKALTADEVDFSFTNDKGPVTEPNNIWQQSNWKTLLFDGDKTNSMAEFKWDLESSPVSDEARLPMDFTMNVTKDGEARHISKVAISGRTNSNGSLKKSKLSYIKADGTQVDLGESTATSPTWEIDDDVKTIIWTPMESNGTASYAPEGDRANRMLSLYEITIEENAAIVPTGIQFDESTITDLKVGSIAEVSATVTPNNTTNPFYEITSSDPSVLSVTKIPMDDKYVFMVQGLKEGDATLTATSKEGNFTTEWNIKISTGADSSIADEELEKHDDLYANLYSEESWEVYEAAYEKVRALLEDPNTDQKTLDNAVIELMSARKALELKGSNDNQESSKDLISHDGMEWVDESSCSAAEQEHADRTIDDNPDTIWHSNYNNGYTLPQWFTIDLGANYNLEQVNYLARQSSSNGHVTHYRIEVSQDNKNFVPVVEGYFDHDGSSLIEPEKEKEIKFEKTPARYVKFIALESLGGTPNAYASCAEINFYGLEISNFEGLQEEIKEVEALDSSDYTVSSWKAVSAALEVAKVLTDQSSAEEVNNAYRALKAARSALVKRATTETLNILEERIADAEALKDDYTEEEFKAVQALIDEGKGLIANPEDAGNSQIVELLLKLADAIRELPKDEVDSVDKVKESLAEDIQFIEEYILTDVEGIRPGKVQELKDAIDEAKALIAKDDATIEELIAAQEKISNKVQELWEIVNKDALNQVIDSAKGILKDAYTEESYNALQDAIKDAEKVAGNDDATSVEVRNAMNSVLDAIQNLVEKVQLDKANLGREIKLVEEMVANIENYVASTVKGLEEKLSQAKDVYANATTQDEIDAAEAMLKVARLNARLQADKAALKEAIEKAETYDLSKYPNAIAQPLRNAVANGKSVLNNNDATQAEVDLATNAIDKAIHVLNNYTGEPTDPSQPVDPEQPGNGDDSSTGDDHEDQTGTGNTGNTDQGSNSGSVNTGVVTHAGSLAGMLVLAGATLAVLSKKKREEE